MEPIGTDDRAELIEEARRSQSDWEDWRPTDCDFWLSGNNEGEEE